MYQSATEPQKVSLVTQPIQTAAGDSFIRSVGPQRSVNLCLTD